MTNQELYYDILQKKYNVLKKNLIIIEQTEEKIKEFKNTIKQLDEIEQEKFKKELELKKELTTNLEDEYKRLYDYINLIDERHRKRAYRLEDFNNIVKDSIDGLEEIEDYDNLDFYSNRLDDISEFLNNNEKYEKYVEEKKDYLNIKKDFEEKYSLLKKQLDEYSLNLLIKLKNSINNNSIYSNLDFDNLDDSIKNYSDELMIKEKELSTYLNSYKALINANITDEEREDYLKFIEEEKKEYSDILEKKYILLIYKYINDNNNEEALRIYEERLEKIDLFELNNNSNLEEVVNIINIFMEKTDEINDIEQSIISINYNIEQVDSRISILKKELNKENIKALLKEFCIEKEYIENNNIEDDDTAFIKENEIISREEEKIQDEIVEDVKNDENIEIIEKDTTDIEDIDLLIESIEKSNSDVSEEEIKFSNKDIFSEETTNDSNEENVEVDEIIKEELVFKNNAIIELKDISSSLPIDIIRQKALNIMKSVCESI